MYIYIIYRYKFKMYSLKIAYAIYSAIFMVQGNMIQLSEQNKNG